MRRLDVVILPVATGHAESWKLPVYTVRDETAMYDILNVNDYFPNGYFTVLLARDPGTNEALLNQYRVYIDNLIAPRPLNRSVRQTLDFPWIGTVIVAKYNKSSVLHRQTFAHISWGEADLLVYILGK